jgi:hypothetical protein
MNDYWNPAILVEFDQAAVLYPALLGALVLILYF